MHGDAESARAFAALPFDHLLFTGSTAVGREVAVGRGGEPDAGDARARRQVAGDRRRGLRSRRDSAAPACRQAAQRRPDLHRARLRCWFRAPPTARRRLAARRRALPDARDNPRLHVHRRATASSAPAAGCSTTRAPRRTVVPAARRSDGRARRKLAPVAGARRQRPMRRDAGGDLRPDPAGASYDALDEAIAYVNARPRRSRSTGSAATASDPKRCSSRPFGRRDGQRLLLHVGAGRPAVRRRGRERHGRVPRRAGFRTFSQKPIFPQSKWTGLGLMSPPYGRTFKRLERWVRKTLLEFEASRRIAAC